MDPEKSLPTGIQQDLSSAFFQISSIFDLNKEVRMSKNKWWAKTLRIGSIILMGLTSAFTLLGGVGTGCVAFKPTGFGPRFIDIRHYQTLYISLFVFGTAIIGIYGIWAFFQLVKGKKKAYINSLIALVLGLAVGIYHMVVSRDLRGSSMPVDAVVYFTILTLLIFLIIRIPSIWAAVNFEKETSDSKEAGGAAAIMMGFLVVTIQYLMSSTHIIGGINYADAWHLLLNIIGGGLIVIGTTALFLPKKLTLRKTVQELN
jgi:hypothetical protein